MPPSTHSKFDLSTELNWGTADVSRNNACLGLKEAEHFVTGFHLLSFQDPTAGLEDDALYQRQQRLDVCYQARGLLFHVLDQAGDHQASLAGPSAPWW